jgi:hypothetical protein
VRTGPLHPSRWRPSYGSSASHISRALDGSRRPPTKEDLAAKLIPTGIGFQRAAACSQRRQLEDAPSSRDLGDGFLKRRLARMVHLPLYRAHPVHVGPESDEVGKITFDRLLIGTQPLAQASELVRGQPSWRPPSLVES